MRKYHQLWLVGLALVALLLIQTTSFAGEVAVITSFPKDLFEVYKAAFEARHPDVTVVVKSKNTSAAVAYIRETASNPDSDLVWASAVDAFATLKEEGLLASYVLPEPISQAIPTRIGSYPIHDPDDTFFGFALSGYGIMWSKPYAQAYKLDTPKEWTDLTVPGMQGHLGMSAPSRSGTTHLTVEAILQGYGWEKGWEILLNLSGNMSVITERSFGVPQGVINGEFGVGIVIDFFGLSAIASGFPVEFVYPSVTPIVPANIGIIKGAPNRENAQKFVNFLLSREGQLLLFDPAISRLPVIPDLYAQAPKGYPNPFMMEIPEVAFDIDLSQRRYDLLNSLFDHVVTFRLKELKDAWEAIYEAEEAIQKQQSKGKNTSAALALVQQARALVTRAPLPESQANDPATNDAFAQEAGGTQAKFETEWDNTAKTNYVRAKKLAVQAKLEL